MFNQYEMIGIQGDLNTKVEKIPLHGKASVKGISGLNDNYKKLVPLCEERELVNRHIHI